MEDSAGDTPDNLTRRVLADGTVEPLSPEEQWEQMEKWFRYFQADTDGLDSALGTLVNAWEVLHQEFDPDNLWNIERGAQIRRVSGTPLGALTYFLDMGLYPPPELLLTLADCWRTYIENSGKITLDDAFLGKPKKSSGNYAKQKRTKFRRVVMTFDFITLLKDGKSRIEAAEIVSQRLGGKPDADSVLRLLRGVGMGSAGRRKAEK